MSRPKALTEAERPPLELRPAPPALRLDRNHLLTKHAVDSVDVEEIAAPTVLFRSKRSAVRELRELRRRQTAAEAIAGLTKTNEVYGFTKGQFSMLDLLVACLAFTGPARMTISTWTAARHEIQTLAALRQEGQLLETRWLVDFTFARRDPQAAQAIRQAFGLESIRVAQNHSKFSIFDNAEWKLVVRTSMNLNMNPRFEDFTIAHDPDLFGFLSRIVDEIWSKQRRTLADASPKEIRRHFLDQL